MSKMCPYSHHTPAPAYSHRQTSPLNPWGTSPRCCSLSRRLRRSWSRVRVVRRRRRRRRHSPVALCCRRCRRRRGSAAVHYRFPALVQRISVTVTVLGNRKKCHCKGLSLYQMIFSKRRFFFGPKKCCCGRIVTLTGLNVTDRACTENIGYGGIQKNVHREKRHNRQV